MNNNIMIGSQLIYNQNCGQCQELLSESYRYELTMNSLSINGTSYCTTCLLSNIKGVDELKQKNKDLEGRMNDLEKLVNELSDMIYYAPNGPGYEIAKRHFDSLKIDK